MDLSNLDKSSILLKYLNRLGVSRDQVAYIMVAQDRPAFIVQCKGTRRVVVSLEELQEWEQGENQGNETGTEAGAGRTGG
jgi:hypothetical protein